MTRLPAGRIRRPNPAKARFDVHGLRFDLCQQAGAGTWQLFSFDPNRARVELDFDASEQL